MCWLEMLAETFHVNVIGYDYYGYGVTQGGERKSTISHETINDDAISLWHHVQKKYKLNIKNVLLYGRSLGSVPTLLLASLYQFGGIILESPFTSVLDLSTALVGGTIVGKTIASWKVSETVVKSVATSMADEEVLIDNRQRSQKIKNTKAMIFHGKQDALVPVKQAETIAMDLVSSGHARKGID